MFPILVFALLLWALHATGFLAPIVTTLGIICAFAAVYMLTAFCVFWLVDRYDHLIGAGHYDPSSTKITGLQALGAIVFILLAGFVGYAYIV